MKLININIMINLLSKPKNIKDTNFFYSNGIDIRK